MSMNLEDELRRLTEPVSAPPTDGAREAITRRRSVLHRRRRTRTAALGGVLMVLVVAGGLVLRARPDTVDTVPATPGPDVAAVTVDGKGGWTPSLTGESPAVSFDGQSSYQVFLRDGNLDGPMVMLFHQGVTDTEEYSDGYVDVPIDDVTGHLAAISPSNFRLDWSPEPDVRATIVARRLDREQVLAFARGLVPRDDDLVGGAPGDPTDVFGFDPAIRPEGITEVDLTAELRRPVERRSVMARGPGQFLGRLVTLDTVIEGPYTHTSLQESGAVDSRVEVQKIKVAGHTGRLFHTNDQIASWRLEVKLAKDTYLEVSIATPVARADVTRLVRHLELLDAAEWEREMARYPGA
jgi:hypothetical protein